MGDWIRRGVFVALAGGGVLAAGMVAGAAGVAAAAAPMTAGEAPLPANAVANQDAYLESVSCASAGNCTAVGYYTDSAGVYQGLLLTQTAGSWGAGVEAPLPANAAAQPYADVASVSCASAGNCTAVGAYVDNSGGTQGLLLTETSGTWSAGAGAPLPADAATPSSAGMESVSCASAGNCTAAGAYVDNSGNRQVLLLTQTSGTWATGVAAPLPADAAATNQGAYAVSVSCASAGNCSAAGNYTDSTGNYQGLLLTQTSGTWAAGVEAVMPAGSYGLLLRALSCASAGNCTAVGDNAGGGGASGRVVLTQTSGTWAPGVEPPLPVNAATGNTYVGLNSVSCAPADSCTVGGFYTDSSGNLQGLLLGQAPMTQPTATALASSVNPSASGQAVTYTATISPGPDAGTVAFTDGTTVIAGCGAAPVNTSTGQATCQTAPGTAGGHNITAAFSGSSDFAASTSATLTQVVTQAACPSLAGCNLSGLDLANAQMPGANLSGANLNGTALPGANLNGANLSGANLNKANLSRANLSRANLTGANLTGADVTGANLAKVTWSDTTCPDGTNSNADGGTCTGHL